MSPLTVVLVVLLILLLVGGLPHWGYTQSLGFGYAPSGLIGIVLLIVLVLVLMGRL